MAARSVLDRVSMYLRQTQTNYKCISTWPAISRFRFTKAINVSDIDDLSRHSLIEIHALFDITVTVNSILHTVLIIILSIQYAISNSQFPVPAQQIHDSRTC